MTKRVIPDYTNQLDLFSQAVEETPASVSDAPVRTSGFPQGRPRPEQMRFLDWVRLPPEDAVRNPPPKTATTNIRRSGGPPQRPLFQPDTDVREEPSPHVETNDGREIPGGKVFDIEPEVKPSRDFHITS
jgi:hypothetical protein